MKKRVLIISGEAWRDESNGGNVLTNLFGSLKEDFEFAQIYTNPALPNNNVCQKYFHLSESEVIKSVFSRKQFGHILNEDDLKRGRVESSHKISTPKSFNFLKKYLLNFMYFIQDILWRVSLWKSEDLKKFIQEYNPDIIFAPMYYGIFLHRLDRYVAACTGKKLVSYVSDDHLILKHFSLSPFFWINRFILRHNVISTAKYYSLLYTMTKEQLEEYQPVLKVPMKVLKKAKDFVVLPEYNIPLENETVKIVYAGNLIYNRYKTLAKLAQTIIRMNNHNGKIRFVLDIYTQTPITKEFQGLLHDGIQVFLKGKVSMAELNQIYQKSDIVLHVESFDLKQKLMTRLSFSTKIIDLIHCGRTIMAICWSKSSPYLYLKNNDIAICVSEKDNLEKALKQIDENRILLKEYAQKAWFFGEKNHQQSQVIKEFKKELEYGV